jgi:tripartite-type tricarboxylate transporter receptor subunit TctC
MTLFRRRALIALIAAPLACASLAWGQAFPNRPVRMVVPYPPGQGADIVGRIVADRLSQKWGQAVVVENKQGGGGVPGILSVKGLPGDGYTLLVGGTQQITVNPVVYSKLPYDVEKDLTPLTGLYIAPLILVVHPSSGLNTIADLVEAAHKEPGKLNYASAGVGTSQHMTIELFRHVAKLDMQHIAYKGSGPAMTDLLGGQVKIMMDGIASALPQINAGKIKPLGVTMAERWPGLPNVPTIAEQSFPGFFGVGWAGLFMPAGAQREVAEKISADTRAILTDPATHKLLIDRGTVPDPKTPQQTLEFIRADQARWAEVARIAKIKLD